MGYVSREEICGYIFEVRQQNGKYIVTITNEIKRKIEFDSRKVAEEYLKLIYKGGDPKGMEELIKKLLQEGI